MRIIIDFDDDLDPHMVMNMVADVVREGKVSSLMRRGQKVMHYCWATLWKTQGGNIVVYARQKDNINAADSFRVYKELTK